MRYLQVAVRFVTKERDGFVAHPVAVVCLAALLAAPSTALCSTTQEQGKASPKAPGSTESSKTPAATPAATKPPADPNPGGPGQSGKAKSLDELLGVPTQDGRKGGSSDEAADVEQAKRLERSLDGASIEDLAVRAVDGMKSAATRLAEAKDSGLGTQRIQEDVVKTLDRLLEEAEKQQRQQKQQSSSSSRRKQAGRPQDQPGDPREPGAETGKQAQRERETRPSSKSSASEENSQGFRSPDQSTNEGTTLDESRIEWGRLPERVRELVLQGHRDRVSTVYERLTREYYRRLAQEASK